ncbi:hypothetical protein SELMODRAFT_431561 [Selaginella moellendorffii]|uniref:F-box domain-containing protein n=1 Tax=Selaginella moellendorffii TaxID=88036 RepID=D8TD22_SELML|nr:hypothetical protein SELMODRAFT_431561 [Selaginella moellendorffii]
MAFTFIDPSDSKQLHKSNNAPLWLQIGLLGSNGDGTNRDCLRQIDPSTMATRALISGLDDDIVYQCLLRMPLSAHGQMHKVSKAWRNVISSAKFYNNCSIQGLNEDILVVMVYLNDGKEDYMTTLSIFELHMNRWSSLASMLCPRKLCASAIMDGQLYVVGGIYVGMHPIAEVSTPVDDRRDPLPPPILPVSPHLALVIDDNMVIMRAAGKSSLVLSAQDLTWKEMYIIALRGPHCFIHSNQIYRPTVCGLLRHVPDKNSWIMTYSTHGQADNYNLIEYTSTFMATKSEEKQANEW